MKKNLLTFSATVLLALSALGQVDKSSTRAFGKKPNDSNEKHERCGTVQYMNELREKYPELPSEEQFETWMATEIKKRESLLANGRSIQTIYNIPVVIHIIHNGDCYGTGENITDAQAISQITVMNQDFRRISGTPGGVNSTNLATDIEINFILATRDPNGNPTTGIVRHNITPYNNNVADADGADWETKADVEIMKQATIWDPTKYLNMWTIRPGGLTLTNGGISDLLGYAQFPEGSTLTGITPGTVANTDGVVAAYNAMGTSDLDDGTFVLNDTYYLGRTMTHEVGHWLGLRHIWGDNSGTAACPSTNTDTTEDYCSDTPASAAANYGCSTTPVNSCTSTPGNDMIQNYMDYTDDYCMDTFTPKQKVRMQTCMASAVRRNTLNTSNGSIASAKAGIYFKYGVGCTNNVAEGTNCTYTDYNLVLKTTHAPTADITVTFVTNPSSTATNLLDYEIITPSVIFTNGSTADKNVIVRIYNDGISESLETISLTATITNTANGIILDNYKDISVGIVDNDDTVTVATSNVTIVNETFETPSYLTGIKDLDGDTNNWGVGSSSATTTTAGYTGNFAFSRSWISPSTALTPDNILYTPTAFTVPSGASSLSFRVGTTQGGASFYKEHYSVYLTTVNPSTLTVATLNAIIPVVNNAEIATPAGSTVITNNVSSYAGQTVYLVFRHHNTVDMNWMMIDDVILTNTVIRSAQTEVNATTKYSALVSQAGTFTANDSATDKLIAECTVTNFNYGCTSVEVNRSATSEGAAAVNFGSNTANNQKVTAKSITITTTNPNLTGTGVIKFYFTEAEIANWETATGNNRSALKVIKNGVSTTLTTTLSALGANIVILSANVSNGIAGVYYFGTNTTLLASNLFTGLDNFSIFPNPNSGNFNIKFNSNSSNQIEIIVNDIRGRQVYNKTYNNNSLFNENIQLNGVETGVYIVTVKDGERKENKKIVIE